MPIPVANKEYLPNNTIQLNIEVNWENRNVNTLDGSHSYLKGLAIFGLVMGIGLLAAGIFGIALTLASPPAFFAIMLLPAITLPVGLIWTPLAILGIIQAFKNINNEVNRG